MVFELTTSTANSKLSLQFTDKSFRPAAKTSGHLWVIQSIEETSWPMMRPRLQWKWLLTSNEWWTGKRPLDRQQAVQSTNMDSEQVAIHQFYSINLRTTNKAVWQVMTTLGMKKCSLYQLRCFRTVLTNIRLLKKFRALYSSSYFYSRYNSIYKSKIKDKAKRHYGNSNKRKYMRGMAA